MVVAVPIFYLVWFLIYIIILFVWSLFINKKKEINKPNKFYYWILRQTSTQLVFLSNTKVHVSGLEKIPDNQRVLFVSNTQYLVRIFKIVCLARNVRVKSSRSLMILLFASAQ